VGGDGHPLACIIDISRSFSVLCLHPLYSNTDVNGPDLSRGQMFSRYQKIGLSRCAIQYLLLTIQDLLAMYAWKLCLLRRIGGNDLNFSLSSEEALERKQ
jgi:hypothetical protein